MKILFFIGSLEAGGKERRLIELLSYLKKRTGYNMLVVARRNDIDYPAFNELNIPYRLLTENYKKKDITLHYKFYKICKEFKPDIVHTWGSIPAFISLLAIVLLRIPLVNSQINNAPFNKKVNILQKVINKINFKYSTVILANSHAGLAVYKTDSRKSKVIYNGINLNRFTNLEDEKSIRNKFGITTPFMVIMVASFSENKDYEVFVEIAGIINSKRTDISFVAVGNGNNFERIKQRVLDEQIMNVIFTGKINNVESLVNLADIGVLFSPFGEGISNSIIEYMALGKPVIANDAGGTKEIVRDGINGYLIRNESAKEIAEIINDMINDKEKRRKIGESNKKLISGAFSIERMGKEFESLYKKEIRYLNCNTADHFVDKLNPLSNGEIS